MGSDEGYPSTQALPGKRSYTEKAMTRRHQSLTLKAAVQRLHEDGVYLMKLHTRNGQEFYIVPGGGHVRSDDAAAIIARPDIIPDANGLFPNCPQSWRMSRAAM